MSRFWCAIAVLTLAWSASPARADGLLYQLPKDGTWATYDIDVVYKGNLPAPVAEATIKGTVRMASVGRTTEDKLPCRWIELRLEMEMSAGGRAAKKVDAICKLLIPEKFLAKGQSPLDHVVRAWKQVDKGAPKQWKKPNDIEEGPVPLFLSNPWKDVKQLDKIEVKSKLGKLVCEGVAGTLELKAKASKDMKCKFENRMNAKSPFGVVASHWMIEPPDVENVVMEWNMKLADLGENAKSELPDAK
jgi:hypothetical protein